MESPILNPELLFDRWMAAANFALVNNAKGPGYRTSGEDPVNGLDCSGLALFILNACGFASGMGGATVERWTAPDFCRKLFTRPLVWNANARDALDKPANYVDGLVGPDPKFGPFGHMFRAYYLVSTPALDHIVMGYGRELAIESTSGVVDLGRPTHVGTSTGGLTLTTTVSTTDRTGVQVRHVNDYPAVLGYTPAMYLSFEAFKVYFMPICTTKREIRYGIS